MANAAGEGDPLARGGGAVQRGGRRRAQQVRGGL
jgi:hypothetical protein